MILGGGTLKAPIYQQLVLQALREVGCAGEIGGLRFQPAQGAALLAKAVACDESPLAGWIDG